MTAAALAMLCMPVLAAPLSPLDPGPLTLDRAVAIAVERSPDITLSGIAVRAAEAAVLSADVAPNPSLTIGASKVNPRQGIGPGSVRDKRFDSAFRIDQLIERGGKREFRTQNATSLAEASRADLAEARRQLKLAVAWSYYDLLAAQERLVAIRDTASLFEGTLAAAQKRKAAGDLAGADVERLRVDALRARNDVRTAESDLKKNRLALLLMMGADLGSGDVVAQESWPSPEQSPNPAQADAMVEQRPDVQAARARVSAAEAALRLAQASRTRDVSVGVEYDRSPASDLNGFVGSNTYGVSVQIPLFVNNYYEGDIRNALAGVDSAREFLRRQQRLAQSDMQRALSDAQSAADRLTRFRQELTAAAEKSVQAAEFAFRNGAIGVTDVLDARRTFRAITLDELTARTDYAKALAAWRSATLYESQSK